MGEKRELDTLLPDKLLPHKERMEYLLGKYRIEPLSKSETKELKTYIQMMPFTSSNMDMEQLVDSATISIAMEHLIHKIEQQADLGNIKNGFYYKLKPDENDANLVEIRLQQHTLLEKINKLDRDILFLELVSMVLMLAMFQLTAKSDIPVLNYIFFGITIAIMIKILFYLVGRIFDISIR